MSESIEGRSRELLEARNFCHVVTTRQSSDRPHVAVVWVHTDGDDVTLNSAEGRDWPANLRRDPRVTLSVANAENPYEYVVIDGTVTEMTHDGADEHIDMLAKKYLDQDEYGFRAPGEQRVLIRIRPDRVSIWGG